MMVKRWGWAVMLGVAGLGLWLLLGSGRVFGHDIGGLGMTLLVGTAWAALHGVSSLPRSELEGRVSPGEWRAWIGTGFMLLAVAYFLAHIGVLASASFSDPGARAVGRNLVLLLIAWAVLSQVVSKRWKGRVQEDERDREIAHRAAEWGRGALVFQLIWHAVTLGFSPAPLLQWATPFVLANVLVLTLLVGWLFEYAAAAVMYWRDRR